MKAMVIIDESEELYQEQKKVLDAHFREWSLRQYPAGGQSLAQIRLKASELLHFDGAVVFASSYPYLMKLLVFHQGVDSSLSGVRKDRILVFYNERDKAPHSALNKGNKSETGWYLV